jgi:hypothetical protein
MRAMVVSLVSVLLVAGCGGGGGGGDGSNATAFSGFSNVPANGVTRIEGQAVTTAYVVDPVTGDIEVVSVTGPSDSTALWTTEGGDTVALRVSAPGSGISVDARNGGTVDVNPQGVVLFQTADGRDFGVVVNEASAGFEYQTFGTWVTGYGTRSGTAGSGSYGLRTTPSQMPAGTSATYRGASVGQARLADGQPYITTSEVTVSTDFATARISSTNTQAVNLNTAARRPASELDFIGRGAISGSGFTAPVSGSGVSGTANGQFYGPTASEVGGTFQTSGPGGVEYGGAFGAN